MGLERTAVSAKLSPENTEFLEEWAASLKPHPVSESSLVDLCVRIVRTLSHAAKLDLEPEALQQFLENARNGRNGGNSR